MSYNGSKMITATLYIYVSSESLFRQLCVVNWVLEAMSQDQNPPVMPLITSSWNLK